MNTTKITPEFLGTLGQAVLDFGTMESIVRSVAIVLSRNPEIAKALLPSGNSVSQNLEIVRRLCHARVDEEVRQPWLDAIDDIQSLFQERNRIFHGMFFEDDTKLFVANVQKGKRGAPDGWTQKEFNTASIASTLQRLSDRRRQLMDFVDDYGTSDDGPPHPPSQEVHPNLSIKAKAG